MEHFDIAKEYENNFRNNFNDFCLMYNVAYETLKVQKDKQFISNVLDYLEVVCLDNHWRFYFHFWTFAFLLGRRILTYRT